MFEFKVSDISDMKIYDINTSEEIGVCDVNNIVVETEIEPYSLSKEKLSFSHEATFEASNVDFSSLLSYTVPIDRQFNLEYSIPIMIQSRWHKKKRINKKWLKRYGMKEDSVSVKCDVESISTNIDNDPYYFTEHVEFGMTLNNMQYKFRPEQLRRNLKIEMC